MKKEFSVAVFCSASMGKNPVYASAAGEIGGLIAKNGWRLVYGHGSTGLMGVVMGAVLGAGGDVYGVSERMVALFEKPSRRVRGETAPDVQTRKRKFIDISDAFVILPGGIGTLDELDDLMIENALISRSNAVPGRKGMKKHLPIIVVNTNGYYDLFIAHVKRMISEGFLARSDLKLFSVVKTPKAAIDLIKKRC
ncbi:MAG: TIGR00730 family Rossman fold protein [Rickettsiales bacterium]|jgi:uncharacterized protein (TIGR00730 family)|nr:TIGR00730 family Rossman fold protein [Rickettsiales bacterium]